MVEWSMPSNDPSISHSPAPSASDCNEESKGQSARVVVIGYGSPIRGDDAIGPLVADQLIDELDSPAVNVVSRHVLTAELAADLQSAELVIFLDAAVDGEVGEVSCRPLKPDKSSMHSMQHFLNPQELLAWVEEMYGRAPEAVLVSTRGASFDFAHYELTPRVKAAIEPMKQHVRRLIGLQA
jgi:hydrogenase maturation protease